MGDIEALFEVGDPQPQPALEPTPESYVHQSFETAPPPPPLPPPPPPPSAPASTEEPVPMDIGPG